MPLSHHAVVTIVCTWSFAFLSSFSMIVALIVNLREVTLDIYLVFIALFAAIALDIVTTWGVVHEEMNEHSIQLNPTEAVWVAKSFFANEVIWSTVNTLLRLAACKTNIKMFGIVHWARIVCLAILSLSIIHLLATLLQGFLICHPLSKIWNPTIAGQCGNEIEASIVLEVVGLALDIGIVPVILGVVLRMHMAFHRKLFAAGLLSSGAVVCIITVVCIVALARIDFRDWNYSKGYLGLLSTVGAHTGIITFALAFMPKAYTKMKLRRRLGMPAISRSVTPRGRVVNANGDVQMREDGETKLGESVESLEMTDLASNP